MKFNIVVCGGTFDHFHKGHQSFLRFILSSSNKIILGLTTEKYARDKKLSNSIENYSKRKNSIEDFFRKENAQNRLEIEAIPNLFIPKKWEGLNIDAIAVSSDTRKGAEIINQDREKRGLSQLKVIVAPVIFTDSNKDLSSFRIRSGEINREGESYVSPLWFKKNLVLPENLRQEFKKPFGELFKDVKNSFKNKNSLVITVGDITTKAFNEKSLGQNISVVDFKVAREKKFSNILELGFVGDENIFKIDNPAGHITKALFQKLSEIFKSNILKKIILEINGEEDLAVLPLVLLSPLGTIIYYGQPPLRPASAKASAGGQGFAGQAGVVRVVVSEVSKDKAYSLISKLKLV